MSEEDVTTMLADLPARIHSFVLASPENTYCIVLNKNLSHEMLCECYKHELEHIKEQDYEKHCSVDAIEFNAHSQKH